MKIFDRIVAVLCALVFVACAGEPARSLEEFATVVYEPSYATGFDISGAEGAASTLITVRNPWQGAEGVEKRLFIAREGERAPEGFEGQVIEGSAERVVCMSSTYVAMIDAIGCTERVVGVSGIDFIYNSRVREAASEGRVHDVGHDSNINFELL
ncbi:MAG: iron ABC transporter substrate-binding protein, partial [Rikenellaceae bacterium]|nr:iron ABC transporter substrate-binding protein [Rikenellaceae bacterium]